MTSAGELLTIGGAARVLGLSRWGVRWLIREQLLRAERTRCGQWLLEASAVDALALERLRGRGRRRGMSSTHIPEYEHQSGHHQAWLPFRRPSELRAKRLPPEWRALIGRLKMLDVDALPLRDLAPQHLAPKTKVNDRGAKARAFRKDSRRVA